jgi:hypothetical protein
MHHLCPSGVYTLLDHAHILALEQAPAIADITPDIMFSIVNGNYHRGSIHERLVDYVAISGRSDFSTDILRKKSIVPT